jgi:antitoxin (DNA-binding transcriptional repressor) of toxin-antitoxin stability system
MTSVAELPEEVREAMRAGRTVAVRERGRTVARIVPVRRPSAADLKRMCARLNALDRNDDWERYAEWPSA